jgi:hypothetical protein
MRGKAMLRARLHGRGPGCTLAVSEAWPVGKRIATHTTTCQQRSALKEGDGQGWPWHVRECQVLFTVAFVLQSRAC